MARSRFSRQVAILRTALVTAYVTFAALLSGAAFVLAWNGLSGAPWFLAASVVFGLWASVTATCSRVSADEFLGVARVLKIGQGGKIQDDAA